MVKLALIGTGKWGIKYVGTTEKMKDCEITHIVSQTKKSLSRFSDNYIKLSNYLDLLDFDTIDGVIIASPGSTHYDMAKRLLHKYPLLVEKPFTLTLKESLQIKSLVMKNKSSLMIGHIDLYNPAYQKIKEILPKIGKIRYISFKGYNYGPFRDDVSALWDWSPHGVGMFIDLMNDLPLTVSAWSVKSLRPRTDLCDNVYVKLTFKRGVECVLECGWLYPFKRRELIIYGSKQTILFDDLSERKVSIFEGLGPTVVDGKIIEKQAIITYPKFKSLSPLEVEINAFLDLIKNQKQPASNLDQGINVIKVIAAAEESLYKKGKVIRVQKK